MAFGLAVPTQVSCPRSHRPTTLAFGRHSEDTLWRDSRPGCGAGILILTWTAVPTGTPVLMPAPTPGLGLTLLLALAQMLTLLLRPSTDGNTSAGDH